MADQPEGGSDRRSRGTWTGVSIAIGAGIGAAIGMALDQLAVGIGMALDQLAVGVAIGAAAGRSSWSGSS